MKRKLITMGDCALKRRRILSYLLLVPLAVCIGTMTMIVLYAFPTVNIEKNIRATLPMYENKDYGLTQWAYGKMYTQLSNFTDAIMLNVSVFRPTDSPIENAIYNAYAEYPENTEQYQNLTDFVNGREGFSITNYPRYWHGYLLCLIPALQIMDVGELKIFGMIVQMFLLAILLYLMGKRNKVMMFLYCSIALFINPITTVLSFQEAAVYIISTVTMIAILRIFEKQEQKTIHIGLVFIINGIFVAFFDFLTYPLVALGIPLITVLYLNGCSIKENMKKTIVYSFEWAYGYIGMWFGKWLIGSLITRTNLFTDAFETIAFRTQGQYNEMVTYGNTLRRIGVVINDVPMRILLFSSIAVLLFFILTGRYKININKHLIKRNIPILIVGVFPFLWYLFVMNHSVIHPMMSYRELSIFIWAIMVASVNLLTSTRGNRKYN